MADAPLLTEALPGFRAWRVDGDGRLWAAAASTAWEPGTNVARCAHGRGHDVPAADCTCGLYAFHHLHAQLRGEAVVGGIAAWGEMEVHRDGFRAGRARVLALADHPRHRPALVRAAERYGVPLVSRAALAPVVAERCGLLPASLVPGGDEEWVARRRGHDPDQQLWVEPGGGTVTVGLGDAWPEWLGGELDVEAVAAPDGVVLHVTGHNGTAVLRTGIRGVALGPDRIAPTHWLEDHAAFEWGPPGRMVMRSRARAGGRGFAHLLDAGAFPPDAVTGWADVRAALRASREDPAPSFADARALYDDLGIALGVAVSGGAAHLGRLDLTLALEVREPEARLLLDLRPAGATLRCGAAAPADVTVALRGDDLRPLLGGAVDLAQAAGAGRLRLTGPRTRALTALAVLTGFTRRRPELVAPRAEPARA